MKVFASRFHSILIAAAILSMPLGALARTMAFKADLTASSEVPPKDSQGTGSLTATLNTTTHLFTYHLTYTGLTGPATMAHFHGPAAVGANAGPEVPIKASSLESPVEGTATLTPAQQKDLVGGMWYVNVHTSANPGGEIRGQVVAGK